MSAMIQKVSMVSSQPQLHHIISNKSQVRRKSSNLSNEDFRNILASSKLTSKSIRQNVKSTQASRSKPNKDKSNKDNYETYHKKPKKRTASYNKWQAKREKYKKNQTSTYRDRAKERREQNNPDYKDNDAYSDITLEASKFLGGDNEHTHLVKGLDYALLEKTRNEMEKEEEEKIELAYRKSQKRKMQEIQTSEAPQIQFLSTLAKTVYRICIEEPSQSQEAITPVEQFQPNRMSFEFDLDMNFGKDMPTTLMQSKRDCPRTDDRLSGMIQRDIHRRITRIMSFIRQGTNRYYRKGKGKLKKLKKDRFVKKMQGERMMGVINERELDSYAQIKKKHFNFDGHGLLQEPNESEDIFAGVGSNYKVDNGDIKNMDNNMIQENNEYFIENGKEIPPTKEEQYEEAEEYDEEEEEENGRLETDHEKEEKEPTFTNDHYAECYPDFQNDGGYIIDVDSDDDDFNKTCSKSSRTRQRHWNFETGTAGSIGKKGNNKNSSKTSLTSNMVGPAGEYVHNASYYANKEKTRKFEKEWEQIQEIMKKREPKTPRGISGRSENSYKRHKILKGFATPTPQRSRNE